MKPLHIDDAKMKNISIMIDKIAVDTEIINHN